MVGLNGLRRSANAARFDHVRIERALNEPLDLADQPLDAMGLAVEYLDEFIANDLAFLFRVGHACQLLQETLAGIDRHQVQSELFFQVLLHFLEFILA